MQKINYKEKIELESKISELLVINIDDKLNQTKESDCVRVSGEVKISGEVNTNDGAKSFNHPIGVDIMLSNEQLIDENINISVDDFNYKIDDTSILIELIMKIDGLKEIEAYFPSQEDQENIQIEDRDESNEEIITEDIVLETEESIENENEVIIEEENEIDNKEEIDKEPQIEENPQIEIIKPIKEKYSLLNQVFKNRQVKKETSYLLHVVKEETSYEQIANLYKIDVNTIKRANKEGEIYKGKLVFIPKS